MDKSKKKAGRPKGSLNQKTKALRQAVHTGITPLDFLLEQMRNEENDMAIRMDAAKSAAKYCHPALRSIELKGEIDHRIDKIERHIVKPKPTDG